MKLRVEVEMEWVASVPTAFSVLERLTRLELSGSGLALHGWVCRPE